MTSEGNSPLVGIPSFIARVRAALADVERLGLRWRGTRFDRYLRLLEQLLHVQFPAPFPWAGDEKKQRLFFEAAGQCQQLVDGHAIWVSAADSLAKVRLERALKGADLPPQEKEESDDSRNVLFELATAASLARSGFSVELPSGEEDLRASFPGLPPFLVECKRPAHEGSLPKNLKKIRHQLRARRSSGKDYGLFVVGVDRLFGLSGKTPNHRSEASLLATIEVRLREEVERIQKLGAGGHASLFPHASIGGILLTGAVFPADRGALFTVSLMRLFCTGEETHKVSRRIMAAFQPNMEMTSSPP